MRRPLRRRSNGLRNAGAFSMAILLYLQEVLRKGRAKDRAILGLTDGREEAYVLVIPLHDESRQDAQVLGGRAEWVERRQGGIELLVRLHARAFEAKQGGVGVLASVGVFASLLAELFGGRGEVEQVVDDLERQPQVPAECADGRELRRIGVGGD